MFLPTNDLDVRTTDYLGVVGSYDRLVFLLEVSLYEVHRKTDERPFCRIVHIDRRYNLSRANNERFCLRISRNVRKVVWYDIFALED